MILVALVVLEDSLSLVAQGRLMHPLSLVHEVRFEIQDYLEILVVQDALPLVVHH